MTKLYFFINKRGFCFRIFFHETKYNKNLTLGFHFITIPLQNLNAREKIQISCTRYFLPLKPVVLRINPKTADFSFRLKHKKVNKNRNYWYICKIKFA